MALTIALRTSPLHSVITAAGELDIANTGPLQAFLTADVGDYGTDMIVDLRQLTSSASQA